MLTIQDFSDFNASSAPQTLERYRHVARVYRQLLVEADTAGYSDLGQTLAEAFEYFRAAEQIGDAYFFEHREFIDKVIERHEVEIPQPALKPKWAFRRAHIISPDYSDRMTEYLRNNHPLLANHFNGDYGHQNAEPVVRVGGTEPDEDAAPAHRM